MLLLRSTMRRTNVIVSVLLLMTPSEVFQGSALDSTNNSKPPQLVTVHGEATLTCPVLQEVVEKDGAFNIAYWSICTSKSCQDQDATWAWIAGMNGTGATKVGREGINMTIDGTLDIHRVRLMCTVKRINHQSPLVHFATLIVNNKDATKHRENEPPNKPDAKDCKKDYSEVSGNLVGTLIFTTCVLCVLLVLAVGYIVYLKKKDLCCWNQRNSSVTSV